MRFYIKDSERKQDPAPVKTNATLAVKVGLVLWVLALVACGAFYAPLAAAEKSWWFTACIFGIALGGLALFKVRGR